MPNLPHISLLKYIHSHHFVHHDIKLQNMMLMSIEGSKDTVFLIDFGIAKHYRHLSLHIHILISQRFKDGTLIGTPACTSVNSHLGLELSWRDDLESLACTLLFLYTGSLPWLAPLCNQTCWSTSAIHQAKQAITTKYCPSIPSKLLTLLLYARSLSFTKKPSYNHLQSILFPVAMVLMLLINVTKMISGILVQALHTHDDNHKMQTQGPLRV
ncbi:kinase-like protein [Gyrodon lividus]|nr:kinase-like protein [Gyrodon lividus]